MLKVLIQVGAGSREKKFYNERTLEYQETRLSPLPYPYPYGFVIGTSAEDGDCLDCYLITKDALTAGTTVACDPVGLLIQDENGTIDHKILAKIPGQDVVVDSDLLEELQEFIHSLFVSYPEIKIRVGPILSREAALQHFQKSRVA